MRRIDNSLNFRTLAMVLGLSVATTLATSTSAWAGDTRTPTLLWPKESIAASQSTKALLIGHTGRAVKFAERALENAAGYDRVVALNNLCLGLIRQGDTARAQQICLDAETTAAHHGFEKVVATNIDITRKANARATSLAEAQR